MNNPFEIIQDKLSSIEKTLLSIKNEQIQSEKPDQWMSLDELVKYDPGKRCKTTWYAKVSRNEVPHRKNGRRLVFRKSEIDRWIENGEVFQQEDDNSNIDASEFVGRKKRLK